MKKIKAEPNERLQKLDIVLKDMHIKAISRKIRELENELSRYDDQEFIKAFIENKKIDLQQAIKNHIKARDEYIKHINEKE